MDAHGAGIMPRLKEEAGSKSESASSDTRSPVAVGGKDDGKDEIVLSSDGNPLELKKNSSKRAMGEESRSANSSSSFETAGNVTPEKGTRGHEKPGESRAADAAITDDLPERDNLLALNKSDSDHRAEIGVSLEFEVTEDSSAEDRSSIDATLGDVGAVAQEDGPLDLERLRKRALESAMREMRAALGPGTPPSYEETPAGSPLVST
ncbi:unnamed protein product, partial [Amoebophrya sp. A25]|eukprot:GSA25T00009894001.1